MTITTFLLAATFLLPAASDQQAPRRKAGAGTATLAIVVSDPDGAPLGQVKVTVEGPASRTSTTENGRIALEGLPAGTYLLRFERDGFVTRERELTARAGAPTNVKVTMTPEPPPPPKPVEPPPPPPAATASGPPVSIDITNFVEKNYVGRAPEKISELACSAGGPAELIQINEPLAHQPHPDADEFVYVVAGSGAASIGGRQQLVQAGGFMLIPRGTPHGFAVKGRNPLMLLSIRAGERCK